MEILKVENIITLKDGNKKYKRIGKLLSGGNEDVEWKSNKSNNRLKESKQKELEEKYKKVIINLHSNNKSVKVYNPVSRNEMDKEVVRLIKAGTVLRAVKHVKEVTGWGLREAKDYVDEFRKKSIRNL